MKKLVLNLIIPITIISFFSLSKWWYLIPIDGADSMFYGFPFPYYGDASNTSMALQFFVVEMIIDFIIYFLIWFIIIFCINMFVRQIKLFKILVFPIWGIAILISSYFIFIASLPDNQFYLKRDFEIHKVIDSGISIFGENRPNYYDYYPKQEK